MIKVGDEIVGEAQGYLADNRQNLKQTMASGRDLLASFNDVVLKDRGKVERLLDGLEVSRARADRVLYQADQIAGQVLNVVARSRAEIERSVTNVRDATDWANKLVQKIYTNPFVLSPFYKPNHEDLRVRYGVRYGTRLHERCPGAARYGQDHRDHGGEAGVATAAARCRSASAACQLLTDQLNETSTRLAEGLKRPASGGRDKNPVMRRRETWERHFPSFD